jgi:hypothetical protein
MSRHKMLNMNVTSEPPCSSPDPNQALGGRKYDLLSRSGIDSSSGVDAAGSFRQAASSRRAGCCCCRAWLIGGDKTLWWHALIESEETLLDIKPEHVEAQTPQFGSGDALVLHSKLCATIKLCKILLQLNLGKSNLLWYRRNSAAARHAKLCQISEGFLHSCSSQSCQI